MGHEASTRCEGQAPGAGCPRCAHGRQGGRYCPRCGLRRDGFRVAGKGYGGFPQRDVRAGDLFAVGAVSNVFRCRFANGGGALEGVLKVARDARTNDLLANEVDALSRLHGAPGAHPYAPFLPRVAGQYVVDPTPPGSAAQAATVIALHPAIDAGDALYTLDEIRAAYPAGLDGRDVAWIWRRVLHVLGFAHVNGVSHGAVLPQNVLVEPAGHKLVLIDWCFARGGDVAGGGTRLPAAFAGPCLPWYRRTGATRQLATPALDVVLAARCMVELLGGDPVALDIPTAVEPALARHFERCANLDTRVGAAGASLAWDLLADFDRLIGILWGPRKFRVLKMPSQPMRRTAPN